jgi:hypothetical protein
LRSTEHATRVVVRIQAHPSRGDLWPALLESVKPLPVEVSEHSSDPPNPWAGYQLALEDGLDDPTKPTHVLVLQDDAKVCCNFAQAVERIAASNSSLVSLFLAHDPRSMAGQQLQAMIRGECYFAYHVSKFVPAIALLWPVEKARSFLEWSRSGVRLPGIIRPDKTIDVRSDDAVIGDWQRRRQEQVLCTAPSLVEHLGEVESTIGKPLGRRAKAFIGDGDPLRYAW